MTVGLSLSAQRLHAATPDVVTASRVLRFLRSRDGEPARLLTTRIVAEPLTRSSRAFGARRLENSATGHADALNTTALSGATLKLHTADGDVTLSFSDAAGRPLWAQNAQGTVTVVAYEPASAAGRPLAATEQPAGGTARVRERYAYALASEDQWRAKNLAGAMTDIRNNAGISRPLRVSLTGQNLQAEQQLLKPAVGLPDWEVTTESDTEEALTVSATYDATGAPLTTTNAANVSTVTVYDISGTAQETRLRCAGKGTDVVTLHDILRQADGTVLSQTAGNGVVEAYEYDRHTHYLTRHTIARLADHPSGALLISDLHYAYDPVGNILTLEDKGADPQWHNNQQATGLREYTYDTLYRLNTATGRERTPVARYSGDLTGGDVWTPYSEAYTYDDGDNLTVISHMGGAGNRRRELRVAAGSNRATLKEHGLTPETGFLAGGLQKQLSDGRPLSWYADNQLHQVSPVKRADGVGDDTEAYHYADGGTRTRKVHTVTVSGGTQTTITTYAGGCEMRQRLLSGQATPQKHVVITEGGGVRVVEDRLLLESHLRYSFSDHLGSSCGEMDDAGRITSREEYAPYGGTVGSDEEAGEVNNLMQRTYRYSGKEMDATGLVYYGWRYYQPELGRWLSSDPAGDADGLNFFAFVRNSPISHKDEEGLFTLSPVSLYRSHKAKKRERRADVAYQKMARGSLWEIGDKPPTLKTLSNQEDFNYQFKYNTKLSYTLCQGSGSFSEAEAIFYARFQELSLELTHFNVADLESHKKMKLYSRVEGEKRGFINSSNRDNTSHLDIKKLGTDDFTFFSLGISGIRGKQSSAFIPNGGYKYTIPWESANNTPYFKHGHFAINDTLYYDTRQTSDDRLWALVTGDSRFIDKSVSDSERQSMKLLHSDETRYDMLELASRDVGIAPRLTLYALDDIKPELAKNTITTIRTLSESTQNRLLAANTPKEFDNIISSFFRPQILVPKKFTARNFTKSRVAV